MEHNYYQLACELAIDAARNHIESRRGIWHLEREDLLCIYDNNPYDDDIDARPRQNFRIATRLRQLGIRVIGHGHDDGNYTTTMLLDCSWDRIPLVFDVVSDEVEETLRELYSDL
jgi:hypothetical protein